LTTFCELTETGFIFCRSPERTMLEKSEVSFLPE